MAQIKAAVITGAGNGIGKELTLNLLKNGTHVHGIDLDSSSLEALSVETRKYSYAFFPYPADVCDPITIKKIRDEAVLKSKVIDLWVNNAGIAGIKNFSETSEQDFDKVLNINLKAVISGTRIALEYMEKYSKLQKAHNLKLSMIHPFYSQISNHALSYLHFKHIPKCTFIIKM